MEGGSAAAAKAALRVLADLSAPPTGARPPGTIPLEWFRWIPMCEQLFIPFIPGMGFSDAAKVDVDRSYGERLMAISQLRGAAGAVRVGWLFVAGTPADGGRRVFQPLLSLPVRVSRPPILGSASIIPAGDAELSPLITGPEREVLEADLQFGGGALLGYDVAPPADLLGRLSKLRRFALAAAAAAGFPASRVVPGGPRPQDIDAGDGFVVVAGYGAYVDHDRQDISRTATLAAWGERDLGVPTAFHAIYGLTAPDPLAAAAAEDPAGARAEAAVASPLVLTPNQRDAVRRARIDAVTVISGAPGTGKSHTIAAIACDAVAAGQRVLVAAKSPATVDALIGLLQRTPGPDPIVFGSNERRAGLAARLAGGQVAPVGKAAVAAARTRYEAAAAEAAAVRRSTVDLLDAELAWARAGRDRDEAWAVAPGLLDPDVDLATAERLAERAAAPATGWWRRRRQRRARERLIRLARADPAVPAPILARALGVARAHARARDLVARGGLDLGPYWSALAPLDDAARVAFGEWLAVDARSPARIDRDTLGAVGALATALRAGRAARRSQLAQLDDALLTRAFPLWIGTLSDVDDLLPPRPGAFDLVLLDEASSIDQALAATALLRARRAAIVGDPRQLRHVSFVSDTASADAVARHGLAGSPLGARLDVRRNSVFDVAASVAPVTVLSEHFRSDPHLVEFVTRTLYGGAITIATRSPLSDHRDCVDAVRVDGHADGDGVVQAEIDYILTDLDRTVTAGATSVGVITPFRAQADALEAAVLARFDTAQIEALDLRVGTVHAFQGNERDVVYCSLAIAAEDEAAAWRFAQDTHLLAVFLTRARRLLVFVHSCDPRPDGLLAAYLAQADRPPGAAPSAATLGPWASAAVEHLAGAGIRLTAGYPTGRHVLDAVFLDAPRPTALVADVHPGGPAAHVDRQLALMRAGWDVVEAYASRWRDRLPELAVDLRRRLAA